MQQGASEFIFSRWVTAGGGWSLGILHVPVGNAEPVFISIQAYHRTLQMRLSGST